MSRFGLGWVLIAVVLVLGALTLRGGGRPQNAATTASKPADTAASLASDTTAPAAAPAKVAPRKPQGASPQTPEELEEQLRAYDLARAKEAEANDRYWVEGFAAQRVNPAWAAPKERLIRDLVASEQFARVRSLPRDFRVECRTTLCQVTAKFASPTAAEDWAQFFMLYGGPDFSGGATMVKTQPDGSAHFRVISAARK